MPASTQGQVPRGSGSHTQADGGMLTGASGCSTLRDGAAGGRASQEGGRQATLREK